jgi:hypothetical protein
VGSGHTKGQDCTDLRASAAWVAARRTRREYHLYQEGRGAAAAERRDVLVFDLVSPTTPSAAPGADEP